MSTFIHGGSGLTLDVGAKAHAAVSRGDCLEINPLVASGDEAYETRSLTSANTRAKQVSIVGIVLGSNGKSTFATGEDILLRVVGICDAALSGTATISPTQVLIANYAGPANNLIPTAEGGYATGAANSRVMGVVHEARTGAGLAKVFINGLSSW